MPGPGAGGPGAVVQCDCSWSSPAAWSAAQVPPGSSSRGSGYRGVIFRKVGSVPRAWAVILTGAGVVRRKKLHPWRTGAGTEGPGPWGGLRELPRVGRSLKPFWRRRGGLHWVRSGPGGCVLLHGPPRFFFCCCCSKEGDPRTEWTGRAATGKGAYRSFRKLATPERMLSGLGMGG